MPLPVRPAAFALGLGLLLVAGRAARGGPPSKEAVATAKIRAALPAPGETPVAFVGEVWLEGVWAGTVKWSAECGTFADKPAWVVREDVFWDFETVEWSLGATYTLARDLALLRAEVELKQKDSVTHWNVARTAKALEGQKQVVTGDAEGPFEAFAIPAPEGATAGYAALALLLQGPLPPSEKALEVAWVDPAAWGKATPVVPSTLKLALDDSATFDETPGKPETAAAKATGAAVEGRLHVARKERAFRGWTGLIAPKAVVLAQGTRPEGAAFDEKAPARTWQDAFLKFGVGYHMARAEILAAAFHWQTMYEYETSLVNGYPAEKPVTDFKKEWVEAFLSESKHRARPETDELLRMTLATGRLETKSEDRVVFHAHKNFGGGIQRDYHLKRIDGIWYIVRIDINE